MPRISTYSSLIPRATLPDFSIELGMRAPTLAISGVADILRIRSQSFHTFSTGTPTMKIIRYNDPANDIRYAALQRRGNFNRIAWVLQRRR